MKWRNFVIILLALLFLIGFLILPSFRPTYEITKPLYQKRRFGLGYSENFGLHSQFLDWYTNQTPYFSALQLCFDTKNIISRSSRWQFLVNTIIPRFNELDIALWLRISTATYDNETERQQVINVIATEIGAQPTLEKGGFNHDWEFARWQNGTLFYSPKPPEPEFKTYWYDWWWNQLKAISPNYIYKIDRIWPYSILNQVEPNGSPRYLWDQGNISPARNDGLHGFVAVTNATFNFLGVGHGAWQFESKDEWENPNWYGYGDYWIDLNFAKYDELTGTGQSAAQKLPFLIYNMEVNAYPWDPVGRDPYEYDPNFDSFIRNKIYENVASRTETYMMNLNSEQARILSISSPPITDILFAINGTAYKTPWTNMLTKATYTISMKTTKII